MDWENTHVDHNYEVLPFSKIINDFVYANTQLNYSVVFNKFYQFADYNTTRLFQEYHLSCAKLRLISKRIILVLKNLNTPRINYFLFLW